MLARRGSAFKPCVIVRTVITKRLSGSVFLGAWSLIDFEAFVTAASHLTEPTWPTNCGPQEPGQGRGHSGSLFSTAFITTCEPSSRWAALSCWIA